MRAVTVSIWLVSGSNFNSKDKAVLSYLLSNQGRSQRKFSNQVVTDDYLSLADDFHRKKSRLMFLMFLRVFKSFYARCIAHHSYILDPIKLRLPTHKATFTDP